MRQNSDRKFTLLLYLEIDTSWTPSMFYGCKKSFVKSSSDFIFALWVQQTLVLQALAKKLNVKHDVNAIFQNKTSVVST